MIHTNKANAYWLVEQHTNNGYLANIAWKGKEYIVKLWSVKVNENRARSERVLKKGDD